NMEQMRRGRGAMAEFFISQHDLNVRALGDTLRLSKSNEQAADTFMDFLDKVPDEVQKRSLLKAGGWPEELANLTGPERRKALTQIRGDLGDVGKNARALGEALAESRDRLDTTLSGTSDMIGKALAEPFTKATDAVREFIKETRGPLIDDLDGVAKSLSGVDWKPFADGIITSVHEVTELVGVLGRLTAWFDNSAVGQLLKNKLGSSSARLLGSLATGGAIAPFAMPKLPGLASNAFPSAPSGYGYGGGSTEDAKKVVKEGSEAGTRRGIFDGMRDWFNSLKNRTSAGGGGFEGMVQKASYSPGGGGGFGAGEPIAPGGVGGGLGPGGGAFAGAGAPGAGGKPGAQRLMTDLINRGWSKEAAAVMAGNVQSESRFNPANNTGDSGTSWGLAQWHGDRRQRLVADANKAGVSWKDWDLQVNLMDKEWRERYGDAIHSHDFNRLARLGKMYEGYSTNTFGERVRSAQQFLRNYKDAAPAAVPFLESGNVWGAGGGRQGGSPFGLDLLQRGTDLDLLQAARRAGFGGATRHEVTGSAGVVVDFLNMPRGVRIAGSMEGVFKTLELNRGVSMPLASAGA
ncbi:MAG: phage tail tip lysozyme, partial [Xanthobacteraceae bacterium]